ncbi:DUF4339 domain-containing protein [Geothrix sp. 21YS21S-4]|uniref:DUF4339 domain-containing protein n=1 Tax=Geothrix sp. 21YS21S-4 TaxID=3068889 RepID=UPI0027BA88A2|nr:DUF4339 domain-containing protein [Geothrix sp. 21YS21S-4]
MASLWNYLQQGQVQGPVTDEQLKALVTDGTLSGDDLVWREGTAEWTPIRQFPGLSAAPVRIELDLPPASAAGPGPVSASAGFPSGAAWGSGGAAVSPDLVELLRRTKPWARFMAVLGFLAIGAMVLISCIGMAVAIATRKASPGVGMAVGGVYLLLAGLHLPPVLFLNRYASRIGDLMASGEAADLRGALAAQKSFWRYVGIFTLVMLCLYLATIPVVIMVGAALKGFR